MRVALTTGLAVSLAALPAHGAEGRASGTRSPSVDASPRADATPSRVTSRDGTGDGWYFENDGPSSVQADPTPKTIDVTRAYVRHGRRTVNIRIRVVNLRRVGTQETNLRLRVPTPGRGDRFIAIEGRSEPRHRGGRLRIEDDQGGRICRHATIRWAYGRDVLRIRMSRVCLGRPAWVRVNGDTSVWFGSDATYVDDLLSARVESDAYTRRAFRRS